MKFAKVLKAIVCADEGDEILIDLETLVDWNIIPKCFPLPMNAQDRVRSVKEAHIIPKRNG